MLSRRSFIAASALSVLVGLVLLAQHQSDYLPIFPTSGSDATHRRLRAYCHADDPFEAEYGRTNIRMTRAYEGKSRRQCR